MHIHNGRSVEAIFRRQNDSDLPLDRDKFADLYSSLYIGDEVIASTRVMLSECILRLRYVLASAGLIKVRRNESYSKELYFTEEQDTPKQRCMNIHACNSAVCDVLQNNTMLLIRGVLIRCLWECETSLSPAAIDGL